MRHEKTAHTIVDDILTDQDEVIEKSFREAVTNARLTGYGFVMVRRNSRGEDYLIKSVLWHEIDEALRHLGAKGVSYS